MLDNKKVEEVHYHNMQNLKGAVASYHMMKDNFDQQGEHYSDHVSIYWKRKDWGKSVFSTLMNTETSVPVWVGHRRIGHRRVAMN